MNSWGQKGICLLRWGRVLFEAGLDFGTGTVFEFMKALLPALEK
jgi:hypothetical protein